MLCFMAAMNSRDWMNSLIAVLLSNLLGMLTFMVVAIFCISFSLVSSIYDWICDIEVPWLIAVMALWSFVFLKMSLTTTLMWRTVTLNL